MEKYIFYKRKSSDSEDKQVASLESQDHVIKETVPGFSSFKILADLEESKSAKAPGRPKFNEMCEMLEKSEAQYIICWQLNRLARNPVDGGRIIWLVQNYGVKIITPSKTYDGNDILLMYVEFAMSNQFINDLKKNTHRGLDDKLRAGMAPIKAPVGYFNDVTKKQGLRDILIDEERFHLVRKMWDLLLTGNYTPPKILEIATNEWGFRQANGNQLSRSKIYILFRNIFYTGQYYEYDHEIHDNGVHQPMITIDEFDTAQKILGVRGRKFKLAKHTFAFNGSVISCVCGSSYTAHERYRKICPECHLKYNAIVNQQCPKCSTPAPDKTTYYCLYHCTKKKNPQCKQPSLKLKDLEAEFDYIISYLTIPEPFIKWALKRLGESQAEEAKKRGAINTTIQGNLSATTRKLDNLLSKYLSDENKNGEIISDGEYKDQKIKLQAERLHLEEALKNFGQQQDSFMYTAEKAFNFARTARARFKHCSKEEKRELVTHFGLNLTLEKGKLRLDYLKPFGKIHEASVRLQDPSNKIEPVQEFVAEGQTFYFDPQNPVWGD